MWCGILDSRGTLMRSFAPHHMLHRGTISYGIGSSEGPPFCFAPFHGTSCLPGSRKTKKNCPFFDQKWHPSVPPPISLLCIYIKAKSEPNSASDWPLLGFAPFPGTSCLSGSPKTVQKKPFSTRNGSQTGTGNTA